MRPWVEWFWREVAAAAALALVAEYGDLSLLGRIGARVDVMGPLGLAELARVLRWT